MPFGARSTGGIQQRPGLRRKGMSVFQTSSHARTLEARLGLDRLPDRLRRYTIAAVAFVGALALATILLRIFGTKPAVIYSLLFDLLIMGSAWLGYGPGVLVCTLTTFL